MKGLSVKFRCGLTNIHKNTIRPSITYCHVIDVYFHTINEFEYLFKKMQYNHVLGIGLQHTPVHNGYFSDIMSSPPIIRALFAGRVTHIYYNDHKHRGVERYATTIT